MSIWCPGDPPLPIPVSAPDPQAVPGEEQFRRIEGMRFRALKAEGRIAEVESQLEAARQREERLEKLAAGLGADLLECGERVSALQRERDGLRELREAVLAVTEVPMPAGDSVWLSRWQRIERAAALSSPESPAPSKEE